MNSPFDILVIGQRGVGKTTMLRKYVMGTYDVPGFELSECLVYKSVENPCLSPHSSPVVSEAPTNKQVSILDSSAGVDTLLTQNSYQINNARTMVFAYSAASSESFEALEYTINCIESVRNRLPPCVIVSLKPEHGQMDQILISQGEELAKSCGALLFQEVYLYSDRSVDDVFVPLIEVIFGKQECQDCSPERLKNRSTIINGTKRSPPNADDDKFLSRDTSSALLIAEADMSHSTNSPLTFSSMEMPSGGVDRHTSVSVHRHSTEKFDEFRTPSLKSLDSSFSPNRRSRTPPSKLDKAKNGCCVIT